MSAPGARRHGACRFDTADMYGVGHSEELVARAFAGRWDRVTAAQVALAWLLAQGEDVFAIPGPRY